jgi:hypothetical protein
VTAADPQYQEKRDIWDDYNSRQQFEHELINRKTTWLLTTQSIIFAAYGIAFRSKSKPQAADEFRDAVAWSGFFIAAIVLFGVLFLINSKRRSWKDYEVFFRDHAPKPPKPFDDGGLQWGVRTWNTRLTLLPEVLLPVVFIVAWLVLIY